MKKHAVQNNDNSSVSSSTIQDNTHNSAKSLVHPETPEEIRKLKQWLTKPELAILETEGKPLPNKVLDCLEVMLLHH